MKFSIENEIFISGPSLAAEKQGLGLKFSIENENFKPRMKISCENENFVRGGMFFSCVRARMNFFDPWALWDFLHAKSSVLRTFWHSFRNRRKPHFLCRLMFLSFGLSLSLWLGSKYIKLGLQNRHPTERVCSKAAGALGRFERRLQVGTPHRGEWFQYVEDHPHPR